MLQWPFKKKTVDVPPMQDNIAISGSAPDIKTDGRKVDAAVSIAAQHQSPGRYVEAEASFKSLLAANPENSEALRMLGALKLQMGQHDSAAELLSRAILLNPLQPNAHSELGKVYLETNRIEEAKSCFVKALELEPNLAEAHYKLGNIHRSKGELDAALACYEKAISFNPNYSEAHNNAGVTYEEKGQRNEAIASYRKALAINPKLENAQFNLGLLLLGKGNAVEALECFNKTIVLNPNSAEAHNLKGVLHQQRREFTEAIAAYGKALSLDASLADTHNDLGVIYQLQGNLSGAIDSFRRAISCRSEFASAHTNLGMTLLQIGKSDEAITALRHAVTINPDFAVGYSNYLFCLSHDENSKPEAVFAEHCAFGDRFEAPFLAQWSRHGNLADPGRRLRVGFVSADLYAHAVASFVEPLWAALDSKLVEIWVYSNNPAEDAVTIRLQGLVHQWRKVHAMSDEALAQKIREDAIDILFDLSGHTADNRLLTFVRRPAPVQVSWIGNPNTTGLTAIDYYLADPYSAPPGLLDSLFTEKIVQLPSGALFQPFEPSPPVNKLPALASGALTFATFGRSDKLANGVIRLWSRVLTAVPGSRMHLGGLSDHTRKANIAEQFADSGIDANRLVFHPRVGVKEYLALHQQVDMILDTFPFGGGTTSCHAVWMGVPVLTLAGKTMSSRVGAIINANVGIRAFTTESADEFVAQAVQWSQRLLELAELRATLRSRTLAAPMCQPHTVARWLETALRTMWQRWCEGKPAQSFSVNADQSISEEAHLNMGHTHVDLMRAEDQLASFGHALAIKPDNARIPFNRSNELVGLKRLEDALASFDRALLIQPDFLEALFNRGNVLADLNRHQDALVNYDCTLAIKADFPEALNNRGNSLVKLKRPEDALVSLDRALAIRPDFPAALINRGIALMDLNRPEDALVSFDRALVISPDFPEALNSRGTALMALNRPENALASFDRALAFNPDFPDTLNNRGNVLVALKRTEDALACFDRALAVKPEDADTHWNEALCRLLIGDFELGWKKYEWRWQTDRLEKREFKKPLWLGEQPLEGRTILLHAEQGLGDTLQFCRYATVVSALGAKVLLEVQPALKSLLTCLSSVSKVFSKGEQLPDFDLHCPLLSLPLAFKTTLGDIPSSIPYLRSDSGKVEQWQTMLGDKTVPRVGLVWTSGLSNRYRSIPLIEFAKLVTGKAQFISLQKEIEAEDRETLDELGIQHFGNELNDFSDTAALLHLMDVVISVDTSVAHLAGAMGKPVWILLPFNADCRWLLDRDNSPWYRTAKLFRQPANGDWSSVIARVEDESTRFLG